ncbi:acyl-coenzyme A:6-aminopenicillanic acid acyl-transferase-domain-containing protein [Xylariales sp. PMI_506]|nr:acyl-coenzyme A:6-aminopenicillanic acid acyl-transferase-domain-containing protein [Xylariales sp. PMI_506]
MDPVPHWNGVPEVVASGSPWQIGFAHGSQIPKRISVAIANYSVLFFETADADWKESKARAATYLPFLEENEPDLVEEMRGIAAGAGVDFLDILALNLRSEISLTNYSDGCTSIATRNADVSEVFLAQNWDWVSEAANSTALFDIRKTGKPRIRMMGEAGIVAKFGINDAGVGICMNAIRCGAVAKNQLPVHLAMRRVLECASFDEALAMLEKKGLASCVNLVIADKSGKLATIECTPKGLAPIYPEDGNWTTFHTNHFWSPNLPAGIRDHPSNNSFSRLERIKELSRRERATVEKIRMWLSDEKGAPGSICRSVPPNTKGVERMETLATIIIDIPSLKFQISFGKPNMSPPIRTIAIE